MSWIIGRSAGSTQPSLGRVSLPLHSCQNPQFGMTINKIFPSPHPSPTRGEGIKLPPRNHRFWSSRKGWTFCAFSLLFTPSAIRHAVSRGSYFPGSTSVPSPLPQGARESFLVLKACHYEEKTSRAECEAACRKDRLSAGQVGRLGVTFKARRSNRAEYKIAYTE